MRLARASHKDSGIRVLHRFVAYDVTVGVEELCVVGRARSSLEAPVDAQYVVLEAFLRGQVAALGLVVDDPVDHLPCMVARWRLPTLEVLAVEQADKSLVLLGEDRRGCEDNDREGYRDGGE